MRKKLITLLMAALIALAMMAAPAAAHPVTPPGLGGDQQVSFAGQGSGVPHSLGLACASEASPAISLFPAGDPLECTLKGGPGSN